MEGLQEFIIGLESLEDSVKTNRDGDIPESVADKLMSHIESMRNIVYGEIDSIEELEELEQEYEDFDFSDLLDDMLDD